jgi:hypothetical protein
MLPLPRTKEPMRISGSGRAIPDNWLVFDEMGQITCAGGGQFQRRT